MNDLIIQVLTIINSLVLIGLAVHKIKETFLIVTIEEWNKIATVFNDAVLAGYVDEDNNFTTECQKEAVGGLGFFKDYVEEYLDEDCSSTKRKDSSDKHKEK